MVGKSTPQIIRYTAIITTVDETNNEVGFVVKGDAQERQALIVDVPVAFRWPVVGETWLVRQENGTWYLGGLIPTANYQTIIPGDAIINSPTGLVHVMGSSDGSTDFIISNTSPHIPGDLIPSAASSRIGCLLCDGGSHSAATYSDLFAAIGYTYGGSSGTFHVPDLRGRAAIGAGTGPGLTARTIGQIAGTENETAPLPAHGHPGSTASDSGHVHSISGAMAASNRPFAATTSPGDALGSAATANNSGTGFANITVSIASAGTGGTHNNMQPFAVVNWFVKY